ncbi:phosphotransferase enzyme family protein [Ideonella sp. YS5]|uniref:phosphotransferase enzyme family protein n=1 Tax=Ideonella sp. YS5 TaxID=3453714 RepID=UPI003EF0220E
MARLDCEIHRLRIEGPRPRELALRIYPPRITTATSIADEITWLAALGAERLHVPTPQRALDGEFIHRWPDGRLAVLLSWVDGRLRDKGLRALHLKRVGRLAGAMHRVSQSLVDAGRIQGQRPGDGPELDVWADSRRALHPALPHAGQQRVEAAARRLREELATFPRDASAYGFIHSDLHLWNLLFEGQAAGAIDFSECGWAHHALDLAAPLQYLKHPVVGNHDQRENYPRLRDALFEGYAEERPWPAGLERQVEAHIEFRMICTIEWVLDCWPTVDARPWGRALLQRAGEFFPD